MSYQIESILLLCLFYDAISVQNCSVKWKMTQPKAVFGENLQLSCSLTGNCSRNQIQKWTGGPQNDVLIFDGAPIQSKYNDTKVADTFTLIIKNLSAEDVNVNYKCCFGFDCFEQKLTLDKRIFEKYPTRKDQVVNYSLINGKANVSIFVKDIYPIPSCFAKINRNTIPSNVHPHEEVLFYSANISTFAEIPECQRTTLKIICIFGSKPIEVYENQIPTYGCKDEIKVKVLHKDTLRTMSNITRTVDYRYRKAIQDKKEGNNKGNMGEHILNKASPSAASVIVLVIVVVVYIVKRTRNRRRKSITHKRRTNL